MSPVRRRQPISPPKSSAGKVPTRNPAPRPRAATPSTRPAQTRQTDSFQAAQTKKPAAVPVQTRVNDLSKAINAWSGYAGSLASVGNFVADKKLGSTAASMKNLTRVFNSVAAEKAVVARGYQRGISQMRNLLKNPAVASNPQLAARIKNQLATTLNIAKGHLAKYDKPLDTMRGAFRRHDGIFKALDNTSKGLAKAGQALAVLGAVTNGVSAGLDSAAQTKLGKVLDGVTAGSLNYFFGAAVGTTPVGIAVGAVDAFTGNNLANTLNSLSTTVATMGEYVTTGSTKGLEELAAKQQKGDYGFIIQGAASAGNALTTLGDPQKMQGFADAMARGDGGPIGRFGNALGEGFFNIYQNLGGR